MRRLGAASLVVLLCTLAVGCSSGGDDERPGQIDRIDGPAVVDENRDGIPDG